MRKLMSIMLVAFMAVTIFTSCNKKNNEVVTPQRPSVDAIAGTFNVQDGDLNFKSAPIGVNRTWRMLTNNADFYPAGVFTLVDGREFIVGSAANVFWSNSANNPVTFSASQSVYSNLTPDEDLRLITETTDAYGNVAYLGMLDFNPNAVNFPLTLHGFRLGDELSINVDEVRGLPGGNNLTFTVNYGLAPINLAATEAFGTLTGNAGVPNGTEFSFADVQYDATTYSDVVVTGSGYFSLYEGLDAKVMGTITITITEAGGTPIQLTVPAADPGHGLKLTLKTTKIGWYDSGTINFNDTDIVVDTQDVIVN